MKNIVLTFSLIILALQLSIIGPDIDHNNPPFAQLSDHSAIRESKELDIFNSDCDDLKFKSIALVSLETSPDVLIGDYPQLMINSEKDDIYISNVTKGEIFRFNNQGKFMNKIGKLGGGPKEFSSFDDICAHGDIVDVLCYMGDKVKIVGYKNDGAFLYSKPINLVAYSFEWMSPGYIFETSYSKLYPSRVYTTDVSGKKTGSFLPNTTGFAMALVDNNFSRIGSKVFCHEGYCNEVYIAENHEFSPAYKLKFDSFKVPNEYFKSNPIQAYQLLQKRAYASILNYFESSSYSFFNIRLKPESRTLNKDLIDYLFVLDKGTNKLMKRSFKMQSEDLFKHMVYATTKDEIVFLIYPYMIFSDKDAFNSLPLKNPEILEKLEIDSNPVLAVCKL
jgi:hypothetical protein